MVLLIENFIFVIVPSILWFYYFFSGNECNSPVDDIISTVCIFYFIIIGLFILYALIRIFISIFEVKSRVIIVYCYTYLNNVVTSILLIIIQFKVQIKYFDNWENNTCNNLKEFILAWLIINYFHLFLLFLIFAFIYYYFYIVICTDEGDEFRQTINK